MGQALYRKYRSMSLDEIVGQEHITETLSKALKSGRISHAYLFTGPRGVGKTSIARILAHEINGLPYDETQNHLDIIEIDAASNNGVEDVRDLREKVYVAPAEAKYKVYIIDEVHMLSKAAFNALLKTLEEPPAHVVFILATTEAHKLPETIVSRTQRFIFRPIDPAKAAAHLKTIAKQEKITVADDAIDLIVEHGSGSFRDSISLLDQLASSGGKVGLDDVQAMLGIAPAAAIDALLMSISEEQTATDVYKQLGQLFDQGFQPANIAKQLAAAVRTRLIRGDGATQAQLELLAALLDVPVSHDPEAHLEIVLLRASSPPAASTGSSSPRPAAVATRATETAVLVASEPNKTVKHKTAVAKTPPTPDGEVIQDVILPAEAELATDMTPPATSGTVMHAANWQQVLNVLKKQHNTLYGIVRMAQPDFTAPGKLTLAFNFAFHQKRANEAKNRQAISNAIVTVAGSAVEVVCVHDADATPPKSQVVAAVMPVAAASENNVDSLASISNIFGGGELLKSE